MTAPLTFPTFSHLSGRGWMMDRLGRVNIELDVLTRRDKQRHVLDYTWTATRYGEPVAAGVAFSRGDCVRAAYDAVFVERRA